MYPCIPCFQPSLNPLPLIHFHTNDLIAAARVAFQDVGCGKSGKTMLEFSDDDWQALLEILTDYFLHLKISETPQSTRTTVPTTSMCLIVVCLSLCPVSPCRTVQFVCICFRTITLASEIFQRAGEVALEKPMFTQKTVKLFRSCHDTAECKMLWLYRK